MELDTLKTNRDVLFIFKKNNKKRQDVCPAFFKLYDVEVIYAVTFVFTLALVFAFSFFFSSGINSKMETGALSPNR
jgi:hypothetical protein